MDLIGVFFWLRLKACCIFHSQEKGKSMANLKLHVPNGSDGIHINH